MTVTFLQSPFQASSFPHHFTSLHFTQLFNPKSLLFVCMELMKLFGFSTLWCGGFKSSKCKTTAKLATARIKLLRNKREVVVRQMRRDIALLIQSNQDATARIRVEHVIREQNIMAANEIIELFCELVVARLTIIAKQRECPADLKEGVSSLIFASPRCSDIPELLQLRDIFEKKYGKDFVSAATELRPSCGVNRTLIEKLSVRAPTGEVKLKFMKEIAKEYQIEWDPAESEKELLKPPEEPIEGPSKFLSAASMPVKPVSSQDNKLNQSANRFCNDKEQTMDYVDAATAANAAAQSAEKAVAAAQVAAYLANRNTHQLSQTTGYSNHADGLVNPSSIKKQVPGNPSSQSVYEGPPTEDPYYLGNNHQASQTTGFSNRPDGLSNNKYVHRNSTGSSRLSNSPVDSQDRVRHSDHHGGSYNMTTHSGVKFDESDGSGSDYDEEMEVETPPGEMRPPPHRSPPPVPSYTNQTDDKTQVGDSHPYRRHSLPRIHPKLPDYDELSSRFEALKFRKP